MSDSHDDVLAAFKLHWTANCWNASEFKMTTTPTDLEIMLMADRVLGMSNFERNRYNQQCKLAGATVDEKAVSNLYAELRAKFIE